METARSLVSGSFKLMWACRKIGASKEQAKREIEAEERENGFVGTAPEDEDEMEL